MMKSDGQLITNYEEKSWSTIQPILTKLTTISHFKSYKKELQHIPIQQSTDRPLTYF